MSTAYLLRFWGGAHDEVLALLPATVPRRAEDRATCAWFSSSDARRAWAASIPKEVRRRGMMTDEVDMPAPPTTSEAIITLRIPDGRQFTLRENYGHGYPGDSVKYMWTEGNYSCDCNRMLHIERQHPGTFPGVDVGNVKCGDAIHLVSLACAGVDPWVL